MEQCYNFDQCKSEAEQLPVIAIMNVRDLKEGYTPLALDPGKKWAAVTVCTKCHQAPKLKAHYFMRGDEALALRLVDFPNLAMNHPVKG